MLFAFAELDEDLGAIAFEVSKRNSRKSEQIYSHKAEFLDSNAFETFERPGLTTSLRTYADG